MESVSEVEITMSSQSAGQSATFNFGSGRVRGLETLDDFDRQILQAIVEAIMNKKGFDLKVLDVRGIHSILDYLVIVSSSNSRQGRSIVDEVQERVKKEIGVSMRSLEGLSSGEWVLLDYASMTVNVFSEEAREFFSLERLWSDAPEIQFDLAGTF